MDILTIGAGLMIALFVLNILSTIVRTNTTKETTYTPALVIFVIVADVLSIGVLIGLLNRITI